MGGDRDVRDQEPRFGQRERLAIIAGMLLLILLATLVIDPEVVVDAISGVRDRLFRN